MAGYIHSSYDSPSGPLLPEYSNFFTSKPKHMNLIIFAVILVLIIVAPFIAAAVVLHKMDYTLEDHVYDRRAKQPDNES